VANREIWEGILDPYVSGLFKNSARLNETWNTLWLWQMKWSARKSPHVVPPESYLSFLPWQHNVGRVNQRPYPPSILRWSS